MKRLLTLLMIVVAILVAGCTGTDHSSSSNGIIIESFGPMVAQVEPNEQFDIIAKIRNVGGAEVKNIRPEIYGLAEWRLQGPYGVPDSLLPPDPTGKIQGEEAEISWVATAPAYATGIDNQEFELRIYYRYSTSALAQIKVATDSYIKSFPSDQQEAKRNELGVKMEKTTSGPISVSITAPSKVLKNTNTLRIVVDIQNIGGGSLTNNELPISIKSSVGSISCDVSSPIKLSSGKSKQIRCTVNVGGLDKGWEIIPIEVDLNNYEYWVNSVASISVLPTEKG